jgi:ribosomal 50S subunit-recycling heat shock protein
MRVVRVRALARRRGPAPEAALLYDDVPERPPEQLSQHIR